MRARFHSRMFGLPVALSGIALILSACSTTRVVKSGQPFGRKGEATLVMRDGAVREITSVKVVGDSLVVSGDSLGSRLPFGQVERLEYVSKGKGTVHGLLVGPLVGAGIGIVLGATPVGQCDPGGGACIFGGPAGVGFVMGIMGLFVGPVVGGQVGVRVTARFDTAAYVPPARPAGSGANGSPEAMGGFR